MIIKDLLQETISALASNKVRSGLTVLGIVIGIASVIAMISIGQGAQNSIQGSIEGLGSNLLIVQPGAAQAGRGFVSSGRGSGQSLNIDDIEAIKDIEGIANISPELQRRFQITSQLGNNTNSTIIGVHPDYASVRNVNVLNGSFISSQNNSSLAKVAVLGPTTAVDLFGEGVDPIGRTIRVNNINLKVIGVLEPKGSSGFFNPDDTVLIPLSTMQKILAGSDSLSNISVAVTDKDQMSVVQNEITLKLKEKHRVTEPDFSVTSQADILGTLTQVTTTFTIFLASIASISLLVGGIGIMNMMLTAVTERTREIGLRMAIGAHRKDIVMQFLIEAILLTFIGGIIGVALGWLLAFAVSTLFEINTSVSLQSVLLAFGVSALIGIVFGYYPALRASKLDPIVALRYE